MEFAKYILWFQGLTAVVSLAIIVYLIIRRSRIRKEEKFEKRTN